MKYYASMAIGLCLLLAALSSCAHKRKIMKDCVAKDAGFFECEVP